MATVSKVQLISLRPDLLRHRVSGVEAKLLSERLISTAHCPSTELQSNKADHG